MHSLVTFRRARFISRVGFVCRQSDENNLVRRLTTNRAKYTKKNLLMAVANSFPTPEYQLFFIFPFQFLAPGHLWACKTTLSVSPLTSLKTGLKLAL